PEVPGLSFHHVLGIYLIAQIAGLTSNIPGGLGVFESVFVLLLGPISSSAAILGSLFVYRIVYYLFPLGVAALLLGGYELSLRRRVVVKAASLVSQWAGAIAPYFFSATTFLGGVVLLISGATPSIHGRMAWLDRFLPLPVIELSHFLGSLIGVALLLLARGLQRRLDSAWVLTSVLLAFGIVFSLIKGFDYEEAIILSVMLAILIPSRSLFYRKSSLMQEALSPGWIVAITTAVLSVVWLTAFSYKHVGFSTDLWWQFSLSGDAPRSWRAVTIVLALLAVTSISRLLRPHRPNPVVPSKNELDALTPLVAGSRYTTANLVFLGDKMVLTNTNKDAFIMYGREGRSWVAMGDPIGSENSAQEMVWQFHELADRHGGWTVFYQVRPEMVPIYLEIGLSLLKLGEEARVNLTDFSLEGSASKPLRHWHRRPESEGCTFRIVPVAEVEPILSELKVISDAWLELKNTREKRFSLGFFNEPYLLRRPVALVEREGRKVGFANLWLGAEKEEISFDLMRHSPDAPSGVMDFLIIELILWGKQQGYRWLDLGMAPLSGLEKRQAAPLWNQLAGLIYRHGEHFYNFQGLRQYKEKFRPVWEPRYMASPGGMAQYRILADVSSLVGGGISSAARSQSITEDTLSFGRFGTTYLYKPAHPNTVVLFVSGDGGWNEGVVDMARALAEMQALVVGIDITHYLRQLSLASEQCSYPAADFEALSQYMQQKEGMVTYSTPALVGYSSGATLVYAILVQAPPNTFRGAVSMGFCPDLPLTKPFCKGNGLEFVPTPKEVGYSFLPAKSLSAKWIAFQGLIDQVCNPDSVEAYVHQVENAEIVALPKVGHGFSVQKNWLPQFREAFGRLATTDPQQDIPTLHDLADLPLVEIPAHASGAHQQLLAVIISGDGGWAGIDRQIGEYFAQSGVAVVGLNSLKYFWSRKTPEQSAADLTRILRGYLSAWGKQEIILIGYSRGADVLPFMAARLPEDLLSKVALTALLGPEERVDFQFHIVDFISSAKHSSDLPTLPEVEKLYGRPLACFYGADESGSLCHLLDTSKVDVVELKGGHHFGGDYITIA
ncbi:MAG: bifunctional lysylphosphatidylglycerol flippase/synthetase MprF, partial [candidate division Zixibacteria bacterium]|nr:bifunctional lysylphosphatidylglycerol flippase/synthetase MprF [candidate division Zixibacteria bacterium]